MAVDRVFRSIIFETLERTLPSFCAAGEIDIDGWYHHARNTFVAEHPEVQPAFRDAAEFETFHLLADEYFRTAKHPVILRDKEAKATQKTAKRQRKMQAIRLPDGSYVHKRTMDMTAPDVLLLLKQIESNIRGWSIQRAFWLGVYQQLEILPEGTTVASVVDEADIDDMDLAA